MTIETVPYEAEALLDWHALADALVAGHTRPRAEISDTFLTRGADTLLNRSAWIDGLGLAVKTVTVFPGNAPELPAVNGAVALYDNTHGTLDALVDFHLVTKWKTAADSLVAARLLAPERPDKVLIVGAGNVARTMRAVYGALFPDAQFSVWNRSRAGAEALAAQFPGTEVAGDLETAVRAAEVISTATMSRDPILEGAWLSPGQYVDLIGAFRPDMREADDAALVKARVFLDSRATVLGHIGELKIPIEAGVIAAEDIAGDYYDIAAGAFTRAPGTVTLFKNGGGAHLDLMTARYVLETWRGRLL